MSAAKQVTVRIPPEVAEAVRALSLRSLRSESAIIEKCLRRFLPVLRAELDANCEAFADLRKMPTDAARRERIDLSGYRPAAPAQRLSYIERTRQRLELIGGAS